MKLIDLVVKIARLIIKGREAGLYDQKPGATSSPDKTGQTPKGFALLLALVLLGVACSGVNLPPLNCRTFGCPSGQHCVPDGDGSQSICIPDAPPPPPPTTQPPASPSPSAPPDCHLTGCEGDFTCVRDYVDGVPGPWYCEPGRIDPLPTPTPSPVPSPSPTPQPSPTPTPVPSPTPCTTNTVQPSHVRVDRDNGPWLAYSPPRIVKEFPRGWPSESYERMYRVVDGKQYDCSTPSEKIEEARRARNWSCPASPRYPGNQDFPHWGACGNYCQGNDEKPWCIDIKANHVTRDGHVLHLADLDGYTGPTCPIALPPVTVTTCPSPVPTPTPGPTPQPSPSVGANFPPPPPGQCNATYAGKVSRVGINILTSRDCGEKCKRDGYLGYVLNFSATPKSKPPYCGHQPDRLECEQWHYCMDGAFDLENPEAGPGIFLTMPGKFTNDVCDKRSDNTFNCHHKPKANETGRLTVTACPHGVRPGDARCSSRVFDVQADGAREVLR